jgi:hypothetical protein
VENATKNLNVGDFKNVNNNNNYIYYNVKMKKPLVKI